MNAQNPNPPPDPDDARKDCGVDHTPDTEASSLEEAEKQDCAYWFSKTPHERLHAAEIMRRQVYRKEMATTPMVRVFTIVGLDDL